MPPIQVKDCPKEVYEGLKCCAARDNRNLSQEMLYILRVYIDAHARNPQDHLRGDGQTGQFEEGVASIQPGSIREVMPSSANAPFFVGGSYAERRDDNAATSRLERRKAAFARIAKLPAFAPKDDGVTTVDLLRESREEAR